MTNHFGFGSEEGDSSNPRIWGLQTDPKNIDTHHVFRSSQDKPRSLPFSGGHLPPPRAPKISCFRASRRKHMRCDTPSASMLISKPSQNLGTKSCANFQHLGCPAFHPEREGEPFKTVIKQGNRIIYHFCWAAKSGKIDQIRATTRSKG